MQLALGAVYGWSVFRKPLSEAYGVEVSPVNLAFTITIFTLGFAAFAGGIWMGRVGPRTVAITSGVLYGLGIFLTSFADNSLTLLYLTYGVIAGAGIGLGYIVPIATLVKWFPDKRGVITGIAVAGFGGGAILAAQIAPRLIESVGLFSTFAVLGIAYLVVVVGAGLFMKNPPAGYKPPGFEPDTSGSSERSAVDYEFGAAVRTWQWYALWALLFLNVTAGISIIAEAAPMTEEITGAGTAAAAALVSIIAIFNGVGRFLWAALSDAIGRKWVFFTMFVIQAALFVLMPIIGTSYVVFTALACIILLCYGGGFGTMPAFAADYFGSANVGRIYGLLLTAWSFAAVVGPLLISYVHDSTGSYAPAFYIIAGIMAVSAIVALIMRPPKAPEAAGARTGEARA
ncbi:MFS transporter [Rubrobacter marinus]|uniref:MFS transporter n=2 Tax=Rubrobacter marinus TaxID=2653852 RepID=A0A6G8Q374_9ACTN|nr:MFS transporter [Rubrobacter marinus]